MKKIISLALILVMLLSLAACKDKNFRPVESTDEEARVMMTFSVGKEKYELRYELYRALFLNFAADYDGGDRSFWSSPDAADSLKAINDRITSFALDIFAAIHHAKEIGYDVYSSAADDRVNELISRSVNGYSDENGSYEGFGGDYDAYLDSLCDMNLNYSVQVLLYRYSIAMEEITKYYAGEEEEGGFATEGGALSATEDDVRSFYFGEDSARVLLVTLDSRSYTGTRVEEIRNTIAGFSSADEVAGYIVSHTATAPEDVFAGVVIGRYSLDSAYYREMVDVAFELGYGETGKVISIITNDSSNYHILYKTVKNEEHFESNYESIRNVYISDVIGRLISEDKKELLDSAKATELYETIDHSNISMK